MGFKSEKGRFGSYDSTSYIDFSESNTMRLYGDYTDFNDLLGDISKLKVVGVGITENSTESTIDFLASANLSDYVYTNYQMSHAWKSGTTVYPHIHFEQANNNMPNFLMEYRWQINGGTKTTSWTRYLCNTSVFTYVSGTLNQIARGIALSPPVGYNISDILQIRVYRDNANSSGLFAGVDPYTGTAAITSVDVHIEIDSFGSQTQYSK